MSIPNAEKNLQDLNKLLTTATAMIPVVGNLISTVVAIFAARGEEPPKEFKQAAAEFQAEIDKIRANDAEARRS